MADDAVMKVEFHFSFAQQGWSELYYLKNVAPTPDARHPSIVALAAKRIKMMGDHVIFKEIRVSNVKDKGRTDLVVAARDANYNVKVGKMGQGAPSPGLPITQFGILLRADTDDRLYHRVYCLRGIDPNLYPDSIGENLRAAIDKASLKAQLSDFITELTATRAGAYWSIQGRRRTGLEPTNSKIVSIAKSEELAHWIVQTQNILPVDVGSRVKISGVTGRGTNGVNGTHVVRRFGDDNHYLWLHPGPCDSCEPLPVKFGKASVLAEYDYVRHTEVTYAGFGFRNTGRGPSAVTSSKSRSCCK